MVQVRFSKLALADDVTLLAGSARNLQHNLNVWNEELLKCDMKISTDKTRIMILSRQRDIKHCVYIDGAKLEQIFYEFPQDLLQPGNSYVVASEPQANDGIELLGKAYRKCQTERIRAKGFSVGALCPFDMLILSTSKDTSNSGRKRARSEIISSSQYKKKLEELEKKKLLKPGKKKKLEEKREVKDKGKSKRTCGKELKNRNKSEHERLEKMNKTDRKREVKEEGEE
ncbi:hypothetical protein ILUMI_02522 [Ignelater luminosus]|uniref:Reverse transcriptase domain-containing protein n=1 Tax=Ignelater luminosus TaxID=2038154 RepID=A0A8K0DNL1_IGNLU|nr:hypothetical protein ILUMI_02522 [Ignelater luminosus]